MTLFFQKFRKKCNFAKSGKFRLFSTFFTPRNLTLVIGFPREKKCAKKCKKSQKIANFSKKLQKFVKKYTKIAKKCNFCANTKNLFFFDFLRFFSIFFLFFCQFLTNFARPRKFDIFCIKTMFSGATIFAKLCKICKKMVNFCPPCKKILCRFFFVFFGDFY